MKRIVNYSLPFFILVLVGANSFELISTEFDYVTRTESKFKCHEEGRFPHPGDCGGYIECVRYPETFKSRFGSCHGAFFDSQNKTCTTSIENFECKKPVRVARSLATDQRYNSLCSEIVNGFVCADCKTAVNCVDGKAYKESCGASDICAESEIFGGAVCYPASGDTCKCSEANDFFIDAYDKQAFFFCSDVGADPDMYHCPGDMEFDEVTEQCLNPNGMPHCTKAGVFPHYEDCSSYYTCITSENGWVQKTFTCDNNLMYNENSGMCEDPCGWDKRSFTCEEEGRFSDPFSCGHYYECIQLGTNDFRQEHRQCPSGYQWVKTASSNGYCATVGTSDCTTLSVNKCLIPQGRCTGGTLSDLPPPSPNGPVVDQGSLLPTTSAPSDIGRTGFVDISVPIHLLHGNQALFRRVSSVPSRNVPAHRGNRRS